MDSLFPHSKLRKNQDKLLKEIKGSIEAKQNFLVDAPTGLGKTAAAIAPALKHALDNELTVFFLTSRHTQHKIAVDTLKSIKKKHDINFNVADIIGRKGMCLQPNVEKFYSSDFNEFCKGLREDYKCEFYVNARKKSGSPTIKADKKVAELSLKPMHTEELIESCSQDGLCPYEIDLLLAKEADVVIADYYHLFNPPVRDNFLRKIEKSISKSIIIIDEGHNLPDRIRNLLTIKISNFTIKNAVKEAKQHKRDVIPKLTAIQDILNDLSFNLEGEKLIDKKNFIQRIEKIGDYYSLIEEFEVAADLVRRSKKQSYISSITHFLEQWQGMEEGFVRILTVKQLKEPYISLSYRCLDPSIVSKEVIENSYSTIIMSGTLKPTKMYADILGFNNQKEKSFENPFPKKNRLNLIIPSVTTKYTERNQLQYQKIAAICSEFIDSVPGNSAIFFPSYDFRNSIYNYLDVDKKILLETPNLGKKEKLGILDNFRKNKDKGCALLGIVGASFSEGIDLPGDLLKCVVVVGLPLSPPDLETQELIKYYDEKFNKGWDYAYVLPALTKTIQTAGRCIRSETDKGIVAFLDYRYALPHYRKCFPSDWDMEITNDFQDEIKNFF